MCPHRPAETWLAVSQVPWLPWMSWLPKVGRGTWLAGCGKWKENFGTGALGCCSLRAGQMGSVHQRNEHFLQNEHYSNEQLDILLNAAQILFSTLCFAQWAQCTVHLWLLKKTQIWVKLSFVSVRLSSWIQQPDHSMRHGSLFTLIQLHK